MLAFRDFILSPKKPFRDEACSLSEQRSKRLKKSLSRIVSGELKLKLKRGPKRSLRNERGQGVLEYILVLVIVLVVILGLVYQFNMKFRGYAEQFFDGYIACLLEIGELPGVSGSVCDEEIKSITDMKAKGLLKFPDSAGAGGGGSSKSGDDKATDGKGKEGKQATRETTGGGGGGGGGGGRSSFGSSGRGGGRSQSTTVGQTAPSKNDSEVVGYGPSSGSGNFGNFGNARGKSNITYIYGAESDEDPAAKGKPPVAKTDKKAENSGALKPRRAFENTTRRSTASVDIDESDFSFGAMLRWLIIGALILAMVIFFGGQLMQIMRSREKGGD
jgi:hypothetical protein